MVQPLNYVVSQYVCLCDELAMDQSKLHVPCFLYVCICVCTVKVNVRKWPIPNVCYAVNACRRASNRGQWVELDLGVIHSVQFHNKVN